MSRVIPGFLTGDELRELSHAPSRLFRETVAIYIGLLLALVGVGMVQASDLGVTARFGLYALAFFFIGWFQFAIVQALHEAAHQILGKKDRRARRTAFAMTYPLALTLQFRSQHLAHHRYFGDPERDPDFYGYGDFPTSKLGLAAHLARNATGLPALASFIRKSRDTSDLAREGTEATREFASLLLTQGVLFLAFTLTLGPVYYIVFWALPLLTVVKLCTAIRLLCEHGSRDKPFVWRSFSGTALQRNFLGAFGLNYHAEHHLYPTVPYENLGRLFALHIEARARQSPAEASDETFEVFEGGHLGLLLHWFRELPFRTPRVSNS